VLKVLYGRIPKVCGFFFLLPVQQSAAVSSSRALEDNLPTWNAQLLSVVWPPFFFFSFGVGWERQRRSGLGGHGPKVGEWKARENDAGTFSCRRPRGAPELSISSASLLPSTKSPCSRQALAPTSRVVPAEQGVRFAPIYIMQI